MLFVVMAAVLFLLAALNQRKLWRVTAGWQYRNPEACEPSDAALIVGRVALVVLAFLSLATATL
jgi:hypothetical protein